MLSELITVTLAAAAVRIFAFVMGFITFLNARRRFCLFLGKNVLLASNEDVIVGYGVLAFAI